MRENAEIETLTFKLSEAMKQLGKGLICGGGYEGAGCGAVIAICDVYRCTDCTVPFHRECARKHFGSASDSAGEASGLAGQERVAQESNSQIHIEAAQGTQEIETLRLQLDLKRKQVTRLIGQFKESAVAIDDDEPEPQNSDDTAMVVMLLKHKLERAEAAERALAALKGETSKTGAQPNSVGALAGDGSSTT